MKRTNRQYFISLTGILFLLQLLFGLNVVNAQIGDVVTEAVQNQVSVFQENDVNFVNVGFQPVISFSDKLILTGNVSDSGCCFRRSLLLTSFDAGVSWEDSGIYIDGSGIQDIFKLDENHIWLLFQWEIESPGPITIVKTTDGGKSWERIEDSFEHGGGIVDEILSFSFDSRERGEIIICYADVAIHVFKTIDGGNTWTLEETIDFSEFYGDGYNEKISGLKDGYREKLSEISSSRYEFQINDTSNITYLNRMNADDGTWDQIGEFQNTFYISAGRAFPIPGNIEDYYHYIENLDSTDKESILSAKNEYRELFIDNNEFAEVAFRIFLDFFHRVIEENWKTFYKRDEFNDVLNWLSYFSKSGTKNPLFYLEQLKGKEGTEIINKYHKEIEELQDYMKCGFVIFFVAEGTWAFKPDYDFVENDVLQGFDFELKEYISFLSDEATERIWQEGYLMLSWEELRQRIARWEDFARNHSSLPETESEIKEEIRQLYIAYLHGGWDPDRMAYDDSSLMLNNDLKYSFEKYLNENQNSEYYDVMMQIYELLEKNNFRYTQELKDFMETHFLGCFKSRAECPRLR